MIKKSLAKSINAIISLNGAPLGGQQSAILNRSADMINITNKINGEWEENLAGKKSWSINCSGLYVLDDNALTALEDAFMKNTPVEVSFSTGKKTYSGKALIVSFPINAIFNKEFKYDVRLLGTGALKEK